MTFCSKYMFEDDLWGVPVPFLLDKAWRVGEESRRMAPATASCGFRSPT